MDRHQCHVSGTRFVVVAPMETFSLPAATTSDLKMPLRGRLAVWTCWSLLLSVASGFKPCPGPCLCYESSELVDCRSRGLAGVPSSVPRGTWLLDLSGNRLTEVDTRSFVGPWTLKILLMSNNSIQTLQPQSLSSLEFLERLDLSFNRLHRLPQDFSGGLSSLQELRLDHNLLQQLDSARLADLENLRKLDLSYNHIQTIDVRAFSGLSRLSLLDLEGNRLNALEDGVLGRLQSLEVLLLGHNNISLIEAEALASLRSLTLLGLRGNQLQHIRFKTILKLQTTAAYLQISSNPWTCDCELQRVIGKIRQVRHLRLYDYEDVTCHAPAQHAGSSLASLDLCFTETATVLIITGTVMLAVIGALVKAERNRKNKQAANDAETETQEK